MSTALTLIKHVWQKNGTTAWEALNHSMWHAVQLAVGAKLKWEPSDLTEIANTMRAGRWLGEHGWESVYSLAVGTDGDSFIQAFEKWNNRKPFIANGVCSEYLHGGYVRANRSHRKRGRIALQSELFIGNLRFECTSISNERIILTSCPGDGKKRTILKLTHADCATRWPAPKKPKKMPPTKPPKGWITRQTSIDAGNCERGTDAFIRDKVTPHLQATATVGDLTGAAITVRKLVEIDPQVARQLARV